MNKRLRVGIVCDYPEEGWASMDLTGQSTLDYLQSDHADAFEAVRICPPFRHRLNRVSPGRIRRFGSNADRILNRFYDYPRVLKRLQRSEPFDLFHIVDHSYGHLVHDLPPGRTIVTCHDLDTFRCLLHPEVEPRSAWFRHLTRRILTGLQAAAAISCDSEATHAAILHHKLISDNRLITNYLGTDDEFSLQPDTTADQTITDLIGPPRDNVADLLHVGSNIPRKRIDVLLDVFSGVRVRVPHARLIKVGGDFTSAQHAQAEKLGVSDAIRIMPFLKDRAVLAALYRRASLVLQPSEAEGFGLPLAEAMACGAPLLVSDIPVLREVAGDAAIYSRVADIQAWIESALMLLAGATEQNTDWLARRTAGLNRAARFRWNIHVNQLATLYRKTYESSVAQELL